MTGNPKSKEGMVLVLVLAALTVITAFVVEFVHGVYINTSLLYNWQVSQGLSLTVRSGTSISSKFIIESIKSKSYTHPGSVTFPPYEPFGDGTLVTLTVEDENSKFNLNSMLEQKGTIDEEYSLKAFKRLLRAISLDEKIADAVADWIDADSISRIEGSEYGAKNAPLESMDEILLIAGIDKEAYDKLIPYITIYGAEAIGKGVININGADVPALMSLSDSIDKEMAERVISYREAKPFEAAGQLSKVAGFETLAIELAGHINVKGNAFGINAAATSRDGLSRTVRCVLDPSGNILYWKEI